jgi:hypothetical protein
MSLSVKNNFFAEKTRKVFLVLSLVGLFISLFGLFAPIRNTFRSFAETHLLHRQLVNVEYWDAQLFSLFIAGVFFFSVLFFISFKDFPKWSFFTGKKKITSLILQIVLPTIFLVSSLFLALTNNSLWGDEAFSLATGRHTWGEIIGISSEDVHPPLFFLILKIGTLLFGNNISLIKLVTIVPAFATLLITLFFLKKEFSDKAAILFGFAFIASEQVLHYSIELRMYSWALFFVTMSALSAWYIVKTGKTQWWLAFFASTLFAAYTHYYAAFGAAIGYGLLFLYLLKQDRTKLRPLFLVAIPAFLLYLPWIPVVLKTFTKASGDFWIPKFQYSDIYAYIYFIFQTGNLMTQQLTTALFFLIFGVILYRSLANKDKTSKDYFALAGLLCPLVLLTTAIAIAILIRPLITARYLFPVCGLIWLFFAITGASIRNKRVYVLLCAVLFSFGIMTFSSYSYFEKKENEGFNQFHAFLRDAIKQNDVFIFPPNRHAEGHLRSIFAYLFPKHLHVIEPSKEIFGEEVYWNLVDSVRADYSELNNPERFKNQRAWIIVSESDEEGGKSRPLPVNAETVQCGAFGWGKYNFVLYRTSTPCALATEIKSLGNPPKQK